MERIRQSSVASGADTYITGFPIAGNGKCLSFEASLVLRNGLIPNIAMSDYVAYGWSVWQLDLQDDHLSDPYDTIWDELVPKSATFISFDFNQDTPVVSGADEAAELSDNLMVSGMGSVMKMADRFRYIHADESAWTQILNVAGTAFVWMPFVRDQVRVSPNMMAEGPSVIMMGLTSPNFDGFVETDTPMPVFGGTANSEWLWYRFLDDAVDMVVIAALGLTESGAETPYVDVMDLLESLLVGAHTITDEPITSTWDFFCESKGVLEVPGRAHIRLTAD